MSVFRMRMLLIIAIADSSILLSIIMYVMVSETPEEILMRLLNHPAENEVLEFKSRKNISKVEMCKYFSALSNEAALRGESCAWMIFGVNDKTHALENSTYCSEPNSLNNLKLFVRDNTSDRSTFLDVYELDIDGLRILMFKIPCANSCVYYQGCAWGRVGESLSVLSPEKYYQLISKNRDWSRQIVKNASFENLDPNAILLAREGYKKVNPLVHGVDSWTDLEFLNKAHITIEGAITNAALILLGRSDDMERLEFPPSIRWILKDQSNKKIDSKILHIPLLVAVEELCSSIQNIVYQYYDGGRLIPSRMLTYDVVLLREAICNCIAHQDYCKNEMIDVIECEKDCLIFKNAGSFIPGSVEAVLKQNAPCAQYRNRFLVDAMRNIGLVENIGSGIRSMFDCQRERMFPMPVYEITEDHVTLTITGRVLDQGFANILMHKQEITFDDVLLLDAVQKHKEIKPEAAKYLRKKGWIKGSKPNYVISCDLLKNADAKTKVENYCSERSIDQYCLIVTDYLKRYGVANKSEIDELLGSLLPSSLSTEQKEKRLKNLRSRLVQMKVIKNIGSRKIPIYKLDEE